MRLNGNRPDDFSNLLEKFALQLRLAQQERNLYIAEAKVGSTKEEGLLRRVYLQIYHSEEHWRRLHEIFSRLRNSGSKVTVKELTFLNGLLGFVVLAPNPLRTGNLNLLESAPMEKALAQSLGEYRKKFPDEDINKAPRRLDRSKTIAAVVRIPVGSKTGQPVDLVILRPRDQEALLMYHRYVRTNPPSEVKTTKFFFNTKGGQLGKDVLFYLRQTAMKSGIKGFTINSLRRAAETENALLDNFPSDKTITSTFLGHSEATAKKFYFIEDERHVVKAASRLLFFLEDAGEKEEKKVSFPPLFEMSLIYCEKDVEST